MGADGEPAQDVLGADDGEREGFQRAVERGEDNETSRLYERCHAFDKGRHVGHVLDHFEQQHGVVALPARGKLLSGRPLIGNIEASGRGMVLSLDATDLWVRLQELLACSSTSVREELKSYAAEKGVQI